MEDNNKLFEGKKAPIDKDELWNKISNHDDFPKSSFRMSIFFISFLILLFCLSIIGYYNIDRNSPKIHQDYSMAINRSSNHLNIGKTANLAEIKMAENTSEQNNITLDQLSNKENISSKKKEINCKNKGNDQSIDHQDHTIVTVRNGARTTNIQLKTTGTSHTITNKEINNNYTTVNIDNSMNSIVRFQDMSVVRHTISSNKISTPHKTEFLFSIINLPLTTLIPIKSIQNQDLYSIQKTPIFSIIKAKKWSLYFNYSLVMNKDDISIEQESLDLKWFYDQQSKVESYAYELGLERNLRSNWSIGLGMIYSEMFQKYSLQYTTKEFTQLSKVHAPYYSQTRITKEATVYHHHSIIDLMADIQKSINYRSLNIGAKVGFGINLSYNFEGDIRNQNFEIAKIDRNIYKEYLSPYIYTDLFLSKKLNNSISLRWNIEGQSSRKLSSNDQEIQHKYWSLKTGIGLQYYF